MAVWRNGRRDGFKTHFLTECEFDSHHGYVNNLLVRVKTHRNPALDDDAVVEQCMEALQEQHPSIEGYAFERLDDQVIQILMWGDFHISDD